MTIKAALNAGLLPRGLSALVERRVGGKEADVLSVESHRRPQNPDNAGATLVLNRPAASIVRRTAWEIHAGRSNRVVVKHHLGRTVAVIEIVSPGNKYSRAALRDFVSKAVDFLAQGVHLLVIDLFPPTPRDPFGIHKAIWDEIEEEDFAFPVGKDRLLAAYEPGEGQTAYVEPVAVGDRLPAMPLFVAPGSHVLVPLEATYEATWAQAPRTCGTPSRRARCRRRTRGELGNRNGLSTRITRTRCRMLSFGRVGTGMIVHCYEAVKNEQAGNKNELFILCVDWSGRGQLFVGQGER